MKLVMTLLARDEEDILEAHLRFHRRQGVDFFIVTDNLSRDRTRDILRRFEARGMARVIEERDDNYAQAEWMTRMARMACVEHGADWVIPSDADEFWWPKEGTLKSTLEALPPEVGILSVPRVNFLPRPEDEGPLLERMTLREVTSLSGAGVPLPPKVCHRARPDVLVDQGNHRVRASGLELDERRQPLIILHFPMRTYSQFERKIRVGGQAYENNTELPKRIGRVWRHLFQLYQAGELPGYFERHVLTDEDVQEGIRAGRLLRDHRLRTLLGDTEAEEAGYAGPSANGRTRSPASAATMRSAAWPSP